VDNERAVTNRLLADANHSKSQSHQIPPHRRLTVNRRRVYPEHVKRGATVIEVDPEVLPLFP